MAQIRNIEGLTLSDIQAEVNSGARFVVFPYCISLLLITFKRGSDIYFIRSGDSAISKALPYIGFTLLMGWWGIPWGPIYSIQSLYHNFRGGKDITYDVLLSLNQQYNPAPELAN